MNRKIRPIRIWKFPVFTSPATPSTEDIFRNLFTRTEILHKSKKFCRFHSLLTWGILHRTRMANFQPFQLPLPPPTFPIFSNHCHTLSKITMLSLFLKFFDKTTPLPGSYPGLDLKSRNVFLNSTLLARPTTFIMILLVNYNICTKSWRIFSIFLITFLTRACEKQHLHAETFPHLMRELLANSISPALPMIGNPVPNFDWCEEIRENFELFRSNRLGKAIPLPAKKHWLELRPFVHFKIPCSPTTFPIFPYTWTYIQTISKLPEIIWLTSIPEIGKIHTLTLDIFPDWKQKIIFTSTSPAVIALFTVFPDSCTVVGKNKQLFFVKWS